MESSMHDDHGIPRIIVAGVHWSKYVSFFRRLGFPGEYAE